MMASTPALRVVAVLASRSASGRFQPYISRTSASATWGAPRLESNRMAVSAACRVFGRSHGTGKFRHVGGLMRVVARETAAFSRKHRRLPEYLRDGYLSGHQPRVGRGARVATNQGMRLVGLPQMN
jgi:hypothetical protein